MPTARTGWPGASAEFDDDGLGCVGVPASQLALMEDDRGRRRAPRHRRAHHPGRPRHQGRGATVSTTRSQLYRLARDLGNVEAVEHGYTPGRVVGRGRRRGAARGAPGHLPGGQPPDQPLRPRPRPRASSPLGALHDPHSGDRPAGAVYYDRAYGRRGGSRTHTRIRSTDGRQQGQGAAQRRATPRGGVAQRHRAKPGWTTGTPQTRRATCTTRPSP